MTYNMTSHNLNHTDYNKTHDIRLKDFEVVLKNAILVTAA